jgi:glycosyltransferase involved in cell wall biosynthesis
VKIALVNRYHPLDVLGGSELQCQQLQGAWNGKTLTSHYLALDGRGKSGEEETSQGKLFRLSENLSLKTFSTLESRLSREGYDIVYIRSFNQLHFVTRVCRRLKIPCVYNTCNITDLQLFRPFSWTVSPGNFLSQCRGLVNRFLNHRALLAMPVITINREHAAFLKRKGVRATCIYNSMPDRFQGPQNKKKMILWVANIKGRKQPEIFLELVRKFSGRGWSFVMVGALQNDRERYRRLIDETQDQCSDFSWLGARDVVEVDALLDEASLLVNTCQAEGFGNNFIQAWFHECPTISLEFDADGIMEREKIGFCPHSREKFFSLTEKLMFDDDLRREMGGRARKWALEEHDLEKNALKYLDFFKGQLSKEYLV